MTPALHVDDIAKGFGNHVAVDGVSFEVPRGVVYGILGPNGAGKSTILRMINDIIAPDRGSIRILDGLPPGSEAAAKIGYLPEERGLYPKMKVGEIVEFMGELRGLSRAEARTRGGAWLERLGLGKWTKNKVQDLSKGMQQKVQFLAAVIHKPDLLILDEPFSGLDPVNQRLLRELVDEEHRRGATVLFSTHVMVHAEQLCDHVVMIHRGEKVLDGGIGEIRARYDPRDILFEPLDPAADVGPLARLGGVARVRKDGSAWEVTLAAGASPASVMQQIAAAVPPARLELRRPTLEDVFIDIVRAGSEGDDATLREAVRDIGEVRRGPRP